MAMKSNVRQLVTVVAMGAVTALQPRSGLAQASPNMGPIEQYRMAETAEMALARSAAPESIAAKAEVLVLRSKGYESASKGSNGFVCLVERSWANNFDQAEFWNPKLRGPICYNPVAVRSVLAPYLTRTQWVLAGVSKQVMRGRSRAARLEPGAMAYMLSKAGYLGDAAGGPWHPHLMFFMPRNAVAKWGANEVHSPVSLVDSSSTKSFIIFAVVVPAWSDGAQDSTSHR
jgi:hypothetical protein